MPSHRTADVPPLRSSADPARLEAELAREKEEVERLRGLLIARDAELGDAKGRLAMIDQGSERLAAAAERIPIPGLTRLLSGMVRLLQRLLR
jgi:hypothetical protein